MIKLNLSALFVFILLSCSGTRYVADTQSIDFTAENIFTGSIEGPAFDISGNLYVVNFQKNGTIGKVDMTGNAELFVELPQGSVANSIQFNSNGDMLLADYPMHNVLKVDMKTKSVSTFSHNEQFNQPNDLCINKRDQLFASDPHWKTNTGKLWRIDPDGSSTLLEDSMGTTNGIELSPDEKILYVNESIQRSVWKYAVDDNGNISNKTLFHQFDDFGMDGMKCDRDGNLYITRYGKGTIAVLSPKGTLIREVQLKGKNCSNLVFGGNDGRTIFVTLQDRKGMERFNNDLPGKSY
ncbi:MAG: SMP-30/gluconolactonase/LRE family protein [Bacteroidota bacterium]|nr:SMP-30/gluconolactonase/LRE family protein [Bacteroidota bacterium]